MGDVRTELEITPKRYECLNNFDADCSFEKVDWVVEPLLTDSDSKELTSDTLRSIPLNYINWKSPRQSVMILLLPNLTKVREL